MSASNLSQTIHTLPLHGTCHFPPQCSLLFWINSPPATALVDGNGSITDLRACVAFSASSVLGRLDSKS